jgi:4-amino-4-deoxy-L-arabinose transferase-like glycosyltransferase
MTVPRDPTPAPRLSDPAAPLPRGALALVLTLFVLLAGLYSVVVPAFETPDEVWHYAFIQHVASGQGLPVSAPNTQALWRQQGVQAPGYYVLAAGLTAWIDQSDFPTLYARANPHAALGRPDAVANRNFLIHYASEGWPWSGALLALHLTRLLSVALGAVTLWAAYQAVAPLIGPRPALTGVAIFAFIPQFIFISAAASNDNAVNALVALVLWQIVLLSVATPVAAYTPGKLRVRFLLLGVLLGLAALSKLSALALLGLAGTAVAGVAWQARSWRILVAGAVWIGLPVLLIAGWWYARNWRLYGDPLAWNVWEANILLRVAPAGWRTIAAELGSLERSFWGLFGWLNVPYPDLVYTFFRALAGLVVLGWGVAAVQWLRGGRRVDRRGWGALLLLLWLLLLAVAWLRFMRVAPAAQGRYFFPAAPTLALLISLGIGAWRIWTLGPLLAGVLAVISALTPFWIIAPAYRPAPANAERAADLPRVEARFGEALAITGIDAAPNSLAPGASAVITVAWEARGPVMQDYSVFVHLTDDDGLVVAQHDTMPGGGLAPTSQWLPGAQRVEAYTVTVPSTAYTPNAGRWAVGLYDAYTPDAPRLPLALAADAGPAAAEAVDNALRFGRVAIETPSGAVPNPVALDFADNVTLAGYSFNRRRLHPGDTLEVTLFWRPRGPVAQEYTTFVHLLNEAHAMYGGHDGAPAPATTAWAPAALVEDRHSFAVPVDTPPGRYQVEVGLYTRPDFDRLTLVAAEGAEGADRVLLGPLEVAAGP